MKKQQDIANELMQLVPGVNWPDEIPYEVEGEYFAQLPAIIMTHVHLSELRSENQGNLLSIPAGYFDNLPQRILQQVQKEEAHIPVYNELVALSPLLASIPRKTSFSIPENYFTSHLQNCPVPIVSMPMYRKKMSNNWLKWAAVACLLTIIGTSTWLLLPSNRSHSLPVEKQLENLNDQDIVNYLQVHSSAFDTDVLFSSAINTTTSVIQNQLNEEVSPEAIEKYLQQTDLSKELLLNK